MNKIPKIIRNFAIRLQHKVEREKAARVFQQRALSISGARAYAHLHHYSLSLVGFDTKQSSVKCVNLILPELNTSGIFAGIRTALEVSCKMAMCLGLKLRIVALKDCRPIDINQFARYLNIEFGFPVNGILEILPSIELAAAVVNPQDTWIVTYWTTAHAMDVAVKLNIVAVEQIYYLIQDYEPGFFPWSTDYALARSTYHAGFMPIVNSSPLQKYLYDVERVNIDSKFVFAPSLDLPRLEIAAKKYTRNSVPRIFFYARPSKPRNLYAIGVASLHLVADELSRSGKSAIFVSAGEHHEDIQLNSTHRLKSYGKLGWSEYFDMLGQSDVVLSLQHSPHPSHPPLDAVTAGCYAITNELGNTRNGLHDRLLVAEAEPIALANNIIRALNFTPLDAGVRYDAKFNKSFGLPLDEVVLNASSLRKSTSL